MVFKKAQFLYKTAADMKLLLNVTQAGGNGGFVGEIFQCWSNPHLVV